MQVVGLNLRTAGALHNACYIVTMHVDVVFHFYLITFHYSLDSKVAGTAEAQWSADDC